MVAQDLGKPIERNAARQVMHVMHADIAGEPVERRRQFIERAAMQRRLGLAPARRRLPCRPLELMLDVEEPHAGGRAERDDRQVDDQERRQTRDPDEEASGDEDAGVGRHRAEPGHGALAHESERQAVLDQEHIERADPEHHQRMAIEPIAEPVAPVAGEIFPDCEGIDVADAAPVEIARRRVMDRVAAPPVIVRGHRQDADRPADPVVDGLIGHERAVPAVVLDHEEADEQAGRERRHGEGEQELAVARSDQHRGPQRDEGQDGHSQLERAARRARPAIGNERLRPIARGHGREVSLHCRHRETPTCA